MPQPQPESYEPEHHEPVRVTVAERPTATDLELSLIRVTHIQHPGPRGGQPRKRDMLVDNEGLKTLLDTLPPADRLRFADGRELACRGTKSGDTVDALVPVVPQEAVHSEFMRRQHRAFCEDMETMRRSAIESHTLTLKNQNDQLKMLGSMADTMQVFMERATENMLKQDKAAEGDLVGKIVEGVMMQIAGPGGVAGLLGAMRAAKG